MLTLSVCLPGTASEYSEVEEEEEHELTSAAQDALGSIELNDFIPTAPTSGPPFNLSLNTKV